MNPTILPKCAALAALTLPATAFLPQNGYEIVPSEGNTVAWPTSLGTPGNFKRIVLGEFAGNVMPGALALVGDRAVYLYEPAIHNDITEVAASGVNDIAVLASGSPGLVAGMLLARTDGLYLASLDINIEPGTSGPGTIQTTLIAAGTFADLDLVRSGDINGVGRDDIVGANGSNVYVMLESGSGWSTGPSFQASGTVREVVVLDWDDDGDGDVAIRLDQSVEIRESDGDLIETQAGVASGGYLAHIPPTSANATERLGWSLPLPAPSTSHVLLVLSYPGTRVNCGVFLQTPSSLLSAILKDVTGGTRVDLLTARPLDTEVRLYNHRATGSPYAAASPMATFDIGPTFGGGDGPPAFGDFTLDGIPDTIAGRTASDEFFIVPGKSPTFGALDPEEAWGEEPVLVQEAGTGEPWVGITVNLPNDLQGFNHVQAILWWSTNGELLEPAAIANRAFGSLVASGSVDVWLPLGLGDSTVTDVCSGFDDEGLAVMVRLVNWTPGSPTVSAAGSPLYGVFANSQETAENMLPPNAPDPVAWFDDNCPGQPPGIGYTPVTSLPPKRSDILPSVPQISAGSAPNP